MIDNAQEAVLDSNVRRILRETADLPGKLEREMRSRPLVTSAVVAGVAFAAGTVIGSRFMRALVVATAPALMRRVLDGPLGERIDSYFRGASGRPSSSHVS
ncbi:MAG TPA: hypothetical protein VGI39_33485 [Polyangiaceae bacterium]|jgi:hypothetical protein